MIPTGQNDAFLDWVLSYDSILWKIARAYAPFGEHVDLHQDLLIALWHAAPAYRDRAKPSTFIYRVALNCALNWTRSRVRYQKRFVDLEEVASELAVVPAPGNDHAERVERLYASLATLSDGDRSLAVLHLDGLSYREIAEVLGISESNVGVKLSRIKKRLAAHLRQLEHEERGAGK